MVKGGKNLINRAVELGLVQPAKIGRPKRYATDEERREVLKMQQRACRRRYHERLYEAIEALMTHEDEIRQVHILKPPSSSS